MKGKEIHIRIDPAIYEQAKQARKEGRLRGSLGQIVERGLVHELETVEDSKQAETSNREEA